MTRHEPHIPGARELFDRASARVDQGTAHRLRRARQDALQARPRTRLVAGLLPVGAVAAAVLALGLTWWMPQRPVTAPAATAGAETSASDAEIEGLMADEDTELYAWLADAPVATRARGPQ